MLDRYLFTSPLPKFLGGPGGRSDRIRGHPVLEAAARIPARVRRAAAAPPPHPRQPRGDCGGGDRVRQDHPADPVPARGRVHQVRDDRLHPAPKVKVVFLTVDQ